MAQKIRLGILFGGRSCEHEVSVMSARSVLQAVDKERYEVTMIGISKEGRWLLAKDALRALQANEVSDTGASPVMLNYTADRGLIALDSISMEGLAGDIDVLFPILHGPYGEDGTIQGLFELAGIAYVGSGVVGSAVGMDKEMMKRAFRGEGFPQLDYLALTRKRWRDDPEGLRREIESRFAYPIFVKPRNLGSSVGVSKIHSTDELTEGMDQAASFDIKIIVEAAAVDCREVECSVLGNDEPRASILGEIVPGNEFYDYNGKYIDDNSELIIPARVSAEISDKVRQLAIDAFMAVGAAGMARVDFFVGTDNKRIYINEINTIPGFTPISMYPKLWDATGIGYSELIDQLIQLALERHQDRQNTRTAL
ncbi:MAG: D-alanine--D-alanine ligase [Gammaproteobacteria bacterium]|nr:D-alanine--D-alanine ligase [Gammaproteobacteria bacterium]